MLRCIPFLVSCACFAQPYLNLGFEGGSGVHPDSWLKSVGEFDARQDASVAYEGRQSFRIIDSSPQTTGRVFQYFPPADAAGKHVRFSGYIKTQNVTQRGAGLYWYVYGDNGRSVLSTDDTSRITPGTTTSWTRFTIDRDVSPDASTVMFGCLLNGSGTAWFDSLRIEINGVAYAQGPDALGRPPTDVERDWILRNAIPINGAIPRPVAEATAGTARGTPGQRRSFADFDALKNLIGNAHIIGMGEGTHGTHEFFQMKHQMLDFLATEVGVTVFGIEANLPEAYRINDYVLTGKGNPRELVKGMHFWTWNAQEVLDMVLWMRDYNASGRGPLQFTGFDLQFAEMAMQNVHDFVNVAEPAYLARLDTIYAQVEAAQNVNGSYGGYPLKQVQDAVAAADEVVKHLDSNRAQYAARYSAAQVEFIVQNARIVEGATYGRTGDPNFRDLAMAANIEWILRQSPPGSKMMLWAHNGHIQRGETWMGGYLAANHGRDYLPVAQILHDGQYNARLDNGLTAVAPVATNDADPSEPGSVEYAMLATGIPRLILDLRKASSSDPASAWLTGGLQMRSIGASAAPSTGSFSVKWDITKAFDVLIFFDHTTASELLPM
jgi:erythromycin esterase